MILYLCEKPSQARDIGQVLGVTGKRQGYLEGNDTQVTWCVGHLLEMLMPDDYRPEWKFWRLETLPIVPDDWQMAVSKQSARQFHVIKNLLTRAQRVVIATDADREGETIGREVLTQCGYRGPVSRLWLSALDDASIRKALNAILPGDKTEPLYQAGMGRARADWLVGMNLSRAYTLLGRQIGYEGVLTVGRVQTPTLKLVVDRDRLIENFVPLPFFDVRVVLEVAKGRFQAKWHPNPEVADEEGRCLDIKIAQAVVEQVLGQTGIIQKAETKRVKEPPPLPLELSTLQQEASRRWGLSAKKTLDTAQSLYETHKATTYPRTDCRYLPTSQFPEVAGILSALVRADATLATLVGGANAGLRSRAWDDKKITAHHAIIPTAATVNVAGMSLDESRLYDLIRRHYIAQFYPAYEYDRTVIDSQVTQEIFRASGRVAKVTGWKAVLQEVKKKEEEEGAEGEQQLPEVKKNEAAAVVEAQLEEKRTKPPLRFTEGTLIQAMKSVGKMVENPRLKQILRETSGIGTEATRANIIENLLTRKLLATEGKKNIVSTPPGQMLVDLLPHSVTDPATTAVWEQALDDIAQGKMTLDEFLGKSVFWVSRLINNVKARGSGALANVVPQTPVVLAEGEVACPLCGLAMRQRKSAKGWFWGCSSYPRCQGLLPDAPPPAEHPPATPGQTCPQCQQGTLVERVAKQGKSAGSTFLGCNRFPQCRFIQAERESR